MAYQHREGSGTLFPNDRKTADNQPDWRGDALINGVLMEISGWDKGERISLAIKKKEPRKQQFDSMRQAATPQRGIDKSDVPGTSPSEPDNLPF